MSAATPTAAPAEGSHTRLSSHQALARLLGDLATVLLEVDDALYLARPLAPVSGSVGQHVRHIVDHVVAFMNAGRTGTVCYDARERGTAMETDARVAMSTIFRLKSLLEHYAGPAASTVIDVSSQISQQQTIVGRSTLARELAFVMNHTTHHLAIIAILLAVQGRNTPEAFGYAPSTPRGSRQ